MAACKMTARSILLDLRDEAGGACEWAEKQCLGTKWDDGYHAGMAEAYDNMRLSIKSWLEFPLHGESCPCDAAGPLEKDGK